MGIPILSFLDVSGYQIRVRYKQYSVFEVIRKPSTIACSVCPWSPLIDWPFVWEEHHNSKVYIWRLTDIDFCPRKVSTE